MSESDDDELDPTLQFDRLILQVFEEQEERCGSLRYPLSTQRHALDFIKLVNRKGFPYVLMCQAIDEKQEMFRSWRLGNGNAYVGVAMMKRINSTVQVSDHAILVHGQVTIIFVVSVCLSVCYGRPM